ncbi:hypothetical protein [Mesorhizobium sp. B2-1-2]|uniref:hypothetical protein n=1 Tax=Mesorhizobium sp. B2-1-2 TaxID=2589973 RepID=UPI001129CBAD|nr:hypothetical protein [Mesorhizobium sp. B2-1-2]TPN11682.1 hypothetical protein FJ971_09750 [Mesorhizobium sp. B2-1-2]
MIRVWEFFGNGDPFFGGSADDRVLYLRGIVPVFLRSWEKTAQDSEARFTSVGEAEAAVDFAHRALPHHLRPRKGAIISIMKENV